MTVAIFDPEVHGRSLKTASSNYAPGLYLEKCGSVEEPVSTCNRVFLGGCRIRFPFIHQELPNIPSHIEKAVSIGRIRADWRGSALAATAIVGSGFIRRLITPREERIQATTSRIFPFRF